MATADSAVPGERPVQATLVAVPAKEVCADMQDTIAPSCPEVFEDISSLPITIALYQDKLSTKPTVVSIKWQTLAQMLVDFVEESPCTMEAGPTRCKGRDCPHKAFSSIKDNPMAWSPVEIEGRRLDANVKALTALVLDFDHLQPDDLRKVLTSLTVYEAVLHTTHNNRADDICLRAVLPISRKVNPSQWHRFLSAAVAFLDVPADPTCKNRSRFYYRPSHPKGAPHDARWNRGKLLNVDEVLAWDEAHPRPTKQITSERGIPEMVEWDLDSEYVKNAIEIMSTHFPAKRRHELCLALAGLLRRSGATEDDARYIVWEIAAKGGSDNPDVRAQTVDHTYALSDDSWMTGYTRACEIVGEEVAEEFGDCLADARNDAFLRNFPTTTNVVTTITKPAQDTLNVSINLGEVKKLISDFASKRSRSMDRDDKIDAILLRRVLDGKPLAFAGDVETVRDGSDSGISPKVAVRRVMGALGFILPKTIPFDAVVEIVRPSLAQIQE